MSRDRIQINITREPVHGNDESGGVKTEFRACLNRRELWIWVELVALTVSGNQKVLPTMSLGFRNRPGTVRTGNGWMLGTLRRESWERGQ